MSGRTFLVEHYWPGSTSDAFSGAMARVEAAVADMLAGGAEIRFLHCTFIPGDEAALSVIGADVQATVEAAYRAAGIGFDRIVEAVEGVESEAATGRGVPVALPGKSSSDSSG